MVTFSSDFTRYTIYGVLVLAGLILLWLGYQVGRMSAGRRYRSQLSAKQADLFTTQQGLKALYESEMATLKTEHAALTAAKATLAARVEEYRKKAAGFGGLFNSAGKRSDAMYALLLENEALEEQLHHQTQKLATERTDSVKESLRNIGYRRVLMSQLLNDNRIKDYVREILEDDHKLPKANAPETKALPDGVEVTER